MWTVHKIAGSLSEEVANWQEEVAMAFDLKNDKNTRHFAGLAQSC